MFEEILDNYSWKEIEQRINSKTASDVQRAIYNDSRNLDDFMALISPSAEDFIEEIAQKSKELTLKRFGKTVRLYIPLYLSNECSNACVYCGFNCRNNIARTTLDFDTVKKELEAIKEMGFESILIVTGEHPKKAGVDYLKKAVDMASKMFAQVSLEVQPLDMEDYSDLMKEGLHSVYVYQETYNKQNYQNYHLGGKKADFSYRLDTPDRLGVAGIHRMGLGVLLGLENWRVDSFFTALHLDYLRRKYWKTKYSISFPRLRPHAGNFEPSYPISDKQLVLLMCAYRLFDEDVEISLSTRENAYFRDNVFPLAVSAMSAGSSTEPGGYSDGDHGLEQFSVDDDRSPLDVAHVIKEKGYDPVWKDWDGGFFYRK
ncbi:MAG: 2-iminoacetate synthase ThiH [Bacteroidales bacterium]